MRTEQEGGVVPSPAEALAADALHAVGSAHLRNQLLHGRQHLHPADGSGIWQHPGRLHIWRLQVRLHDMANLLRKSAAATEVRHLAAVQALPHKYSNCLPPRGAKMHDVENLHRTSAASRSLNEGSVVTRSIQCFTAAAADDEAQDEAAPHHAGTGR